MTWVDPTSIIDLDRNGWFKNTAPSPREILAHMKRILNADLRYPVILNQDGSIMDGAHRTCKAILEGAEKIAVVRFTKTPEPTRIIDDRGL